MKSIKNKKKDSAKQIESNDKVLEPMVAYGTFKQEHSVSYTITENFTYNQFKKIAQKAPFTIGQWATLLHISERTLHRYAHDNSTFNGLLVERILLLERFIDTANTNLGKAFKPWLDTQPFSIFPHKVFDILVTHEGIEEAMRIIMRIQYGISA